MKERGGEISITYHNWHDVFSVGMISDVITTVTKWSIEPKEGKCAAAAAKKLH